MFRREGLAALFAAVIVTSAQGEVDAGLLCQPSCEQCEHKCTCEKKHCIDFLKVTPAPRARTAIAVPAVVTNQRADRQQPKSPVPPAPAADDLERRVDSLDRDVQIIKEQLRVITTLLQEHQK